MKTSFHHIIITALTTVFAATIATSEAQDWPGYLFDNGHSSNNKLATAITPANASTLVADWSFVDPGATLEGQPIAGLFSSPTVFGGVVYIGSNTGNFYALDEATGAVLWQQLLGFTTPITCGRGHGVTSTATLATDPVSGTLTVYVGGGDGYLYALDAATGNIVFRQFVCDVGTTKNTGFIWASPTIVSGKIYLGYASQCDNPLVRSAIKSYDQHTGTLLKTFFTCGPGTTGAGVWSTAASDGRSLWITTGNSTNGAAHAYAIVKLNASNLRFQTEWINPVLSGDLDWGSSPTLFTVKINNVKTQLVGANGKDGIFHEWVVDTWQERGPDDRPTKIRTWTLLEPVARSGSPPPATTAPNELKVTLELHRSTQLQAWWAKIQRNYRLTFDQIPFWRYVGTSLFLVILNLVGTLLSCSLVAYSFARLQWPGRSFCFALLLATMWRLRKNPIPRTKAK